MSIQLQTELSASTASQPAAKWTMFLVILILPLIGFLYSLCFLRYSPDIGNVGAGWIQKSRLGFETKNRHCDVLIYGDSSAMTGLNPQLIEKATGLKSCNIAVSFGAIVVVGEDPLKTFLANNPRPKYLVLQYSANALRPGIRWGDSSYLEGVDLLARYYPISTVMKGIATHPDSYVGVLHAGFELTGEQILRFGRRLRHPQVFPKPHTEEVSSFMTLPFPGYTTCEVDQQKSARYMPDPGRISQLRADFTGQADHLIITVAPTAPCDSYFKRKQAILSRAGLEYEQFPIDSFNDQWVHFTSAGSQRLSLQLANEIQQVQDPKTR